MDMLMDLPYVGHFLSIVLSVARFLIMLSVLVFVHELGHFVVAKWCGIYVATFSIGFGRRLFGFKRGETDYRISAVPFGGYVKMIGQSDMPEDADVAEDPDELACPDHMRFDAKPVWQRVAVSFAGPAMSLAFGVVVFWAMFVTGVPMPRGMAETRIGYVVPGGPADEAGIHSGDRVLRIGDYTPKDWEHLRLAIVGTGEHPVDLQVEDEAGRVRTVTVTPQAAEGETLVAIGIQYHEELVVETLFEGQPAGDAGMKVKDIIIGLRDPAGVQHPASALHTLVREHMGEGLTFLVRRDEERMEIGVTPARLLTLAGVELDGNTVVYADASVLQEVPRRQLPKRGDTVAAVNGIALAADDPSQLAAALEGEVGVPVAVQFRRGERLWSLRLKSDVRGIIGIRYSTDMHLVQYGPVEAVPRAVTRFKDTVWQTIVTVGYLIRGTVSVKEMAGPLGILQISGQAYNVGWAYYLYIVGIITINLGIINLLPIPILDGGNIAMLLLEGVRRRPLTDRAMYYVQHAGLIFIVALFMLVTLNDVRRFDIGSLLERILGSLLG